MKHEELAIISWSLLKRTFHEFNDDNAISLSYYTIFSLPPLLIVILSVFSFFFGREAVTGRFFGQINGMVGNKAAIQIQETIKDIELSDSVTFATILGGIMLLIGASGDGLEIRFLKLSFL